MKNNSKNDPYLQAIINLSNCANRNICNHTFENYDVECIRNKCRIELIELLLKRKDDLLQNIKESNIRLKKFKNDKMIKKNIEFMKNNIKLINKVIKANLKSSDNNIKTAITGINDKKLLK